MTLTDTSLVFGPGTSGGTVTLSSVERAELTGGNSPNSIYARDYTGATAIHGGNQTDTVVGGHGDDSLAGDAGNDELFGNEGNDTLDSTNSGNALMDGGSGNDLLIGGNGKDSMIGGDGNDTLRGGNGADTLLGQAGDDVLEGEGGNDVVDGGADFDEVVGTGAVNFTITNSTLTGLGTDTLSDIEQARLTGGTNNTRIDATAFTGSLIASGGRGGTDTLIGGGRGSKNRFELLPSGTVSLIDTGGLNEVSFATDTSPTSAGYSINLGIEDGSFQNVDGSGYLVGLNGLFQNAFGSAGGDNLTGNDETNFIDGGDGGDIIVGGGAFGAGVGTDTFVGGDGSDTITGDDGGDVIVGDGAFGTAPGNDSLTGGDGSDIVDGGAGNDVIVGDGAFGTAPGNDSLTGGAGDDSMDGGGGDDVIVGDGAFGTAPGNDSLTGGDGDDSMDGGSGNDVVVGGAGFDTVTGGAGNDALDGGDGDDIYLFAGTGPLGADTITEAPNVDTDTLDFSVFGFAVRVNLALTSQQTVASTLKLTLSSATGLENVVGSQFADAILGNSRPNKLDGADLLREPAATGPTWNGVTQVVYLDFDNFNDPGEYVYTGAEESAILSQVAAIYSGFHISFTLTAPGGDFAHLKFNDTPSKDGVLLPGLGGLADDLDFRNIDLGGSAQIDVNGLLDGPGEPVLDPVLATPERENLIALTATIGAHELGHLLGLRHIDSFGPIGSGISPLVDPGRFHMNPLVDPSPYTGPAAATETNSHLMATPASVGSSLFDAVAGPFIGEREAIKLAFNESPNVVAEQGAAHGTRAAAQAINLDLASLYVPNTLQFGANAGKDFAVRAVAVTGVIGAGGEFDYYSFTGKKGDLINLEVLSPTLAKRYSNTIDSVVRVETAGGTLVAENDDDMDEDPFDIGRGSILIDLVLPDDGTYFIKVSAFAADTGNYELFLNRFDAGNATDLGDALVGNDGNDTLSGGLGRDVLIGGLGADALDGGSGDDILIGGRASFDADFVTLLGVMADWARNDLDYKARTQALSDRLNSRTVFADSDVDTLVGGADTDWFFGDKLDNLPDRVSPGEIFVKVN
ncbi:MAG TPA: calcium-binding protein [Fimbriiglobus sp.]|nr:calcium-binding protein [Fimbriiglobus sp.]